MENGIGRLHEMIADIKIAMMTTRRADGHLVSRAMATQEKRAPGADLWFMTTDETRKLEELREEPHVNLAYYKDRTREWISVSGLARTSRDPDLVRQLWGEDWKAWLPDEGDPRHGTPDDPRIVLIGVDVHAATYFESRSAPVVLFELAKGWATGKTPDVGSVHQVRGRA
jgi:general stress protein 26